MRPHTATHGNTHCNTLQHTRCAALQAVRRVSLVVGVEATHCNALPRTATHCNKLQHTCCVCVTGGGCRRRAHTLQHTATHCNTLQRTATHCNALQHTCCACVAGGAEGFVVEARDARGKAKVAQLHCQPLPLSCLVRTKQRQICQKRPEYITKNLRKRPTDMSTVAQLDVSPCPYPQSYLLSTAICQKRPVHIKRDLYTSKETCTHQKRPVHIKRGVQKRPTDYLPSRAPSLPAPAPLQPRTYWTLPHLS